MKYQPLATKYRPQSFTEVVGHDVAIELRLNAENPLFNRIVIDLGKIRRAGQTASDCYLFHTGYSHGIYLNQDYCRKHGGWLPTPVITYTKKETS